MPLHDPARDNVVTVEMKMKYGIEPVFFPHHPGGSFAEYDALLATLKLDIVGRVPEQLAEEVAAGPVHPVAAAEPAEPIAQDQVALVEGVREGVEHLREMTRANIARRRTGDLE
jgi:hypothetical protein